MEIIDEINRKGRITNKDLQNRFKITPQAVHKELKKLIEVRVIILVGSGRGAYYELV
jgi:predicted transcriptional regulator